MAFEDDELKKRRQEREQERSLMARQRRLLRIGTGITAVVLVLCATALLVARGMLRPRDDLAPSTGPAPTAAPDKPDTVIHFVAGGDLNVTDKTVAAGDTGGGYDYTKVFLDIAPILADADLCALNFEGNLADTPYGSLRHSAPQQMMTALKAAGVDLIQAANSQSIANGLLGLRSTLQGIRDAGMEPVGAYSDTLDFSRSGGFLIREVQGVRVAIVAFTKGMDGMGLPEGSENCVNLLYKDYNSAYQKVDTARIQSVLQAAAAQEPDITIALLHWGSEFNNTISPTQKKIRDLMLEEGVDAIIGTHSHYVQDIEFDQKKGSLVAYGLGDLLGDGVEKGTDYSILLDLEITKDGNTGKTAVTDYSYTPIYILDQTEDGKGVQVVRIRETMAAYEGNSILNLPEKGYEGMKAALTQVTARLEPPEPTEPTEPTNPSAPSEPTGSTEPSEPSQPTQAPTNE